MKQSSFLAIFLVFVLAVGLVSCQSTGAQVPDSQSGDIASSDIEGIKVNSVAPSENKIGTEEFPLNNCGGTGELRQNMGTSASVVSSVTVGLKATVQGGGEVTVPEAVKLKLELAVEGAYQNTYESVVSRVDTFSMPAKAGTHVVYIIGWYEQVYESTVRYLLGNQVYEVPYVYKLRIPKIDGSYQVACDTSATSGIGENQEVAPSTQVEPTPAIPSSSINTSRWEQEADQVPATGTSLKWDLQAGQLLYLSGGQIRVNGEYCGNDTYQICVLVYKATTPQTVIVDALIPGNNWYGISSFLTPNEAVAEKEPQFWQPPNCTSGCKKATILFFEDGELVDKDVMFAP